MDTFTVNQEPASPSDKPDVEAKAHGASAQRRAGAPEPLLPITNRGVMMTTETVQPVQIALHWLGVTLHSEPGPVAAFLMDRLVGEFDASPVDWTENFVFTGSSGRRYKEIHKGPYGVSLYAFPNNGVHCHVEIKGDAIDQLGQLRLFEFLESLPDMKAPFVHGQREPLPVRCSVRRVDIAFDHAPFSPMDCYEAHQRGDIRCKASRDAHHWHSNSEGDTFYIGSKMSGRLIRIYNRRGFTRLEMQFRHKWAQAVGARLIDQGDKDLGPWAFGLLRDFVDFVDRTGGGSASRAPLLPWWAAFVGNAEKCKLALEKPYEGALIVRTRNFLQRLIPTLCVIRRGLGVSLDKICDESENLLKPTHHYKIKELLRESGK
jgi:hypothetical protein